MAASAISLSFKSGNSSSSVVLFVLLLIVPVSNSSEDPRLINPSSFLALYPLYQLWILKAADATWAAWDLFIKGSSTT